MIEPIEVQRLIEAGLPGAKVEVTGDGSHFDAWVVSESFEGKRTLERHQMVNAIVHDRIIDGTIHALSLKQCATPAELAEAG